MNQSLGSRIGDLENEVTRRAEALARKLDEISTTLHYMNERILELEKQVSKESLTDLNFDQAWNAQLFEAACAHKDSALISTDNDYLILHLVENGLKLEVLRKEGTEVTLRVSGWAELTYDKVVEDWRRDGIVKGAPDASKVSSE